ncbi:hypothetical protein Acsp04_60880 [Actinomadura sp. NBRC 104425]|uniref:hypothetical protein n=1 Tax=Actinomadura sp. NBRC 104425 TaxID=3032204 RepID=UPI0024A4469C|nr:hypothetical protein [Actinomadura sp. NBRC 104425]GLZ15853.1 hypothetical protein Acsp04_60880 [Actinomadura sp. NBRC 104425]
MASAERIIIQLGETAFRGQVGRAVATYARDTQTLAHDMAAELDVAAERAQAAMWKLRKLPEMRRVDVWVRARMVSRHLRRARALCQGISAEAVRFNVAYRREFLDLEEAVRRRSRRSGEIEVRL